MGRVVVTGSEKNGIGKKMKEIDFFMVVELPHFSSRHSTIVSRTKAISWRVSRSTPR
jgi:hypothetical protein